MAKFKHQLRSAVVSLTPPLVLRPLKKLWRQARGLRGYEFEGSMQQIPSDDPSFLETRQAITKFLFLADDPAPVDLCFVLGSASISTMVPAVDLFLRGLAPKILISGHGPRAGQKPKCDTYKAYALKQGIPQHAILLERKARNTLENFVLAKAVIEREIGWHALKRVAIAAQPFHMRRALMTARMQWPPHLRYLMLPSSDPNDALAETWWQTRQGRSFVLSELRAIGAYALEGQIGGF